MDISSMPSELQEIRGFLPEMVVRLESVVPYVSALVTQESGTSLRLDSRREIIAERQPRRGIVFTLFNGRYFQEWATDNLDRTFFGRKDWRDVRYCSRFRRSFEPRFFIDPGDVADDHFTSSFEIDPDDVRLTDMVDECRLLIQRLHQKDSRVVNSSINYQDSKEYKIFVNRKKKLSSALTTCNAHLVVVGSEKGSVHMNFISSGGVAGFEIAHFT